MTPKPVTFGSNRNIRRYRYYNYRKGYSERYVTAMNVMLKVYFYNEYSKLREGN